MSSFLSIPHYSPFLVLLVGLSTFVGLWGLGIDAPQCIPISTSIAMGSSHGGTAGCSSAKPDGSTGRHGGDRLGSFALRDLVDVIAQGVFMLLVRARSTAFMRLLPTSTPCGPASLLIAVIAAAISINALVALAPSTKIDELYYHMLVPSRIVSDSMLRFYREPWLGAMWPQMVYQISAAPTHAIGFPDAMNVVSWALSMTLLWFAWQIIHAHANTLTWTAFCVASLCVGIYPVVWHVTGGAYAMGDLAMAAAVVAFCLRERLLAAVRP